MDKTAYHPRFGYDIRIKREDAAPRKHMCAVPGCQEEGVCLCPLNPRDLNNRQWLCLEHAREHNRNWDFFAGMSDAEIARFQEEAVFGHRPTWPLGKRGADIRHRPAPDGYAFVIEDDFSFFAETDRSPEPRRPERVLTQQQRQAFEDLELEISASLHEIKARYKELVKRFHPDAHGGDRGMEERLRQVIRAYGVLRASGLT